MAAGRPHAGTDVGGFMTRERLEGLQSQALFRKRIAIEGAQGRAIRIGGREFLNFCSNDYLGLATDLRVIEALQSGAARYGAGAGASPLVCGRSAAHEQLEADLASFLRRDRVLLFSSGYLANLAVVTAFAGRRDDLIAGDRLIHASLVDAALLARARFRRYAHADATSLSSILHGSAGRRLVVTDGVFSMDGDLAPLRSLADACREHNALLVVDDAHGLGVIGKTGRGSLEVAGLAQAEVPLLTGTLGKAFGASGAFVAGDADLIEAINQAGRSYIYSTAPAPALMVAASKSLEIIRREEPYLRLQERTAAFRAGAARAGLPFASETPIQPLIVGDPEAAVAATERLLEQGIFVAAIRPPTVPAHSSRLRVTLSAAHSAADIERLTGALCTLVRGAPVTA